MLFNSIHFIIFLPVVFSLYWLLPQKWRWLLLLIASYYFYMSWNPWFGLLLAGTTVVDWFIALKIQEARISLQQKTGNGKLKTWFLVSIFSNLGSLAAFKYSAFLYNTFEFASAKFSGHIPSYMEALIIPVGLSFYTFQSLSYTIDVYRGKIEAEKSLPRFALYVSFFPQLVAGPVERFSHLMPQFRSEKKWNHPALVEGVRLMIWGFFKKIVIADRLHEIVTPVFNDPAAHNGSSLFIVAFFFAVQVYCDFSGYSDIARGTAKLFGFDLLINFKRPLLSTSLHSFWKRNHLSMTTWFRDYLYISLGGNRVSSSRHYLNIFLTFLISGLWHGASWTFVIWGGIYGVVYLLEIPFMKIKRAAWMRFPLWIYLIIVHSIIMIAFRANSMKSLTIYTQHLFSNWNFHASWIALTSQFDTFPVLLSIALIIFLFIKEAHEEFSPNTKLFYERHLRPWTYVFLFVGIFVLGEFNANEFIYFHF